jgi:hypothetical protein
MGAKSGAHLPEGETLQIQLVLPSPIIALQKLYGCANGFNQIPMRRTQFIVPLLQFFCVSALGRIPDKGKCITLLVRHIELGGRIDSADYAERASLTVAPTGASSVSIPRLEPLTPELRMLECRKNPLQRTNGCGLRLLFGGATPHQNTIPFQLGSKSLGCLLGFFQVKIDHNHVLLASVFGCERVQKLTSCISGFFHIPEYARCGHVPWQPSIC